MTKIPVDKLFYTPEQVTGPLEMGLDAVEAWMACGHLKYTCEKERGKRRIWWEDMLAFGKWYREKYLACPSTSPETKPVSQRARSGSTTSNVVALDFADRSTAKAADRPFQSTGPRKKLSGRKRSLERPASPNGESGRG